MTNPTSFHSDILPSFTERTMSKAFNPASYDELSSR